MRKLFLLLAPGYSIESKAYQRIKVPIRARAGGVENVLIESVTVLNNEKDFSKFDQIDRESYHLLGRPTDRVLLGVHVTEPFF